MAPRRHSRWILTLRTGEFRFHLLFIGPVINYSYVYGAFTTAMTNLSRLTLQQRIVEYRERARFAIDSASRRQDGRESFLELARSWNDLAEALEFEFASK